MPETRFEHYADVWFISSFVAGFVSSMITGIMFAKVRGN